MRLHRSAHSQAFTLIEVTVSLFLLGMVVAAVYSSWNAIVRGSRVGLDAAAEVQRSRIAMRTVEEALTACRMFVADGEYYGFESENGNKAFISFVSKLPDSFPRSGKFGDYNVRRVTFALEPGQDSESQLVLKQCPLLMDMDVDEQNHPVVLAQNVKKFELGFWDLRTGDWLDEWAQTNQLPPMVRITLQFGGKKNRFDSKPGDEVTRVVALPAIAVPVVWQRSGQPGAVPGPAFASPGTPGVIR